MRTRVKICGFTQVQPAVQAAKFGVDAIGLVFYPPSPRAVTIEQAQQIVGALPAFVTVVGLFVDESEARIRQVLAQVSIDCLQFHGQESPEQCRRYAKPYLKALRVRQGLDIQQQAENYADAAGLLLDAYHPDLKGGTGDTFNWDLIPQTCQLPIILAGGLNIGNIKQAIHTVRPYALDVSSGVESQQGVKDVAKIAALMTEVNLSNLSKDDSTL
jgi:phosphoribosylanthranilate isomerase